MNDRRGSSVVDLVIVLTILGILASIAIPTVVDASAGAATRGARDSFVTAHGLARASAIRRSRPAELHIDAASARFWVEVDTSAFGTSKMDTVGVITDLSDHTVTITSDADLLCFDARGIALIEGSCAAGATIVFQRRGESHSVQVTSLGKVLR